MFYFNLVAKVTAVLYNVRVIKYLNILYAFQYYSRYFKESIRIRVPNRFSFLNQNTFFFFFLWKTDGLINNEN